MPTALSQLRNSDSLIIYEPFEKTIAHFNPQECPLTTSAQFPNELQKGTSRGTISTPKVVKVEDAVFTFRSEEEWPNHVTVNHAANYSASDTNIQLADGDCNTLVPNMQLVNKATGEQMTITEVHKGENNYITVVRAHATTDPEYTYEVAAGTILHQATLEIAGTALKDQDTGSSMRATAKVKDYKNYIQLFDVSSTMTEQAQEFTFQGGKLKIRLSRRMGNELARNFEFSALYGQPGQFTDSDGNTRYTMCGLVPFIAKWGKVNMPLNGATPTFDDILEFENSFPRDGQNEHLYLTGTKGLVYADKWATNKWTPTTDFTAYGIKIVTLHCTHADIKFMYIPMLDREVFRKVLFLRFNPAKDMTIRQGLPWAAKECGRDNAQTWTTTWVHGGYSAAYNLVETTAGMIYDFADPY